MRKSEQGFAASDSDNMWHCRAAAPSPGGRGEGGQGGTHTLKSIARILYMKPVILYIWPECVCLHACPQVRKGKYWCRSGRMCVCMCG